MAKKKQLNKRVILLISVFVVVVAACYCIYLWQQPNNPKIYITEAKKCLAKSPKDYGKAFKAYNRAIGLSEGQQKAGYQYQLAKLCFERVDKDVRLSDSDRGEINGTGFRLLSLILQRNRSFLDAHYLLENRLWLSASRSRRDWKRLKEYISTVDRILKIEEDAGLYHRRGIIKTKLADSDPSVYNEPAIDDLRRAVMLAPTETKYWKTLAMFLSSLKRNEEAEAVYKEGIKANPKKADILLDYATFLQRLDRDEETFKVIQDAIAAEPDKPHGYISLAGLNIQKKKFKEAVQALEQARKIDKSQMQIYFLLSGIRRAQKDIQGAAQVLRSGLAAIENLPADKSGRKALAVIRRMMINFWLAEVLLDICDMSKDKAVKDKALLEARRCYDNLTKLGPSNVYQTKIAGRLAFIDGDWNKARQALEKSMAGDLGSAVKLISVYERLGMPGAAENRVAKLLQLPQLTDKQRVALLLRQARFRMIDRGYVAGRNYAKKALQIDPDNKIAKSILQALDIAEGKSRSLPKDRDSARLANQMMLRRAKDMIMQEKYDRAIGLLEKVYARNPKDYQVLSLLAKSMGQIGREKQAVQLIQDALKVSPDDKDLKRWLLLLQEPDAKKRLQIEMQFADQESDPLKKALGKWAIYRQRGQLEEALKYLKEAEKIDPDNLFIIRGLFRQAVREKELKEAESLASRAGKIDKTVGELLLAQVKLSQKEKDYKGAISLLENILRTKSYLRTARLMLAECYLQTNEFDKAEEQYKTCVFNDRKDIAAMVGLSQLALRRQKLDEYRLWIRKAYNYPAGKADKYVREQYIRLEMETKAPKAAIAQREGIFAKEKTNLDNAFRLGRLYEMSKQLDKAQRMYEYIYQNASDKVRFASMLANFYMKTNRSSKADELFGALLAAAKDSKTKVAAYIAYGNFLRNFDPASARAMYNKAIETDKDDVRGQKLLADLTAGEAQILTQQGKPAESRAKWKESIGILRKIVDKNPQDISVKKVLYRRYINADMLPDAIHGFRELLAKYPDDPQVLVGLGLARLKQNDLDAAETLLKKAVKLQPDAANAHIFLSEIYQARGDLFSAAEETKKATQLTENVRLRMNLAKLYKAMDKNDEAARTYDDIIRRYNTYIPAYRSLLNLWSRQAKWTALERLARAAQKKFPQSPEFSMILATMWQRRGDPARQIKALEAAMAIAPENVAVVREYLYALAQAGKNEKLASVSKKYLDRPAHKGGARAILAQSQARQQLASEQAFGEFLSALGQLKNPGDVFFVMRLMQETYGPEKITAKSSEIRKVLPKNWRVLVVLGDAYSKLDKNTQAEQSYQQALALCTAVNEKTMVLGRLALIYARAKKLKKTEETYRKIIQLNPNSVAALNNLAYLYVNDMNRPKDALPLIREALRMQSGNTNLIDTYAWTLARLGKLKQAREELNKLIRKDVSSVDVLYHMGYVLEKTNDLEGARGYYQNALDEILKKKDSPLRPTVQAALERVNNTLKKKE